MYERAREGLERFKLRDHSGIADFGRTLIFDHGHRAPRATLLFHGLSASPKQFVDVAHGLYERGHNVLVPRLPRHGYTNRLSDALATMNANQLKACAADTLEIARGLGEEVCVAGFSLGGLLAAHVGQHNRVSRIVAIAPFMGVAFVPGTFRAGLAKWVLGRPNRFLWWDPIAREQQRPTHGYPRYASHAVAHGLTLAHELLKAARLHSPEAERLIVVINAREAAVNNSEIRNLVRAWEASKPGAVTLYTLTGLPFAHDIIEPERDPKVAGRVAPVLIDLIDA